MSPQDDSPNISKIVEFIQQHKPAIQSLIKENDPDAELLVSAYQLYYARPEHIALALMQTAVQALKGRLTDDQE